ncbi:hypothetical protein P4S52_19620 [Vibrio sp. SA48]|nr:hypothetical protein [Vibrio sp. S12_S33]MBD1564920.1 hypothetical protein [Vibrio sp. S12_S33]
MKLRFLSQMFDKLYGLRIVCRYYQLDYEATDLDTSTALFATHETLN